MNKLLLTILGGGAALLGLSRVQAEESRPPNFVVIFVDDLGYADLGCFGSPDIKTPRLDALAKEGMRFTHFYAQHICGPSRAALMTGCHPLRVAEPGNVKEIHPVLHTREITVAEVLKTKGYATGCFGKWDLARHSQRSFIPKLMPNHQGFDYFYGTPTSNDGYVDIYRNETRIKEKADMSMLTKNHTDEAIQFIEKYREQPFFAYIPYSMVHTRLDASPDFKGKSPRGLYGDCVEEIDFNCGRIIDTLKKHELVDNTYFLFTSDNGPWLVKNRGRVDGHRPADHGGSAGPLRSGKVSTWEGGVRVPTILWAPDRVPAGTTCDKIAATTDILPTFAALAGVEAPTDRVLDGIDIRHLFQGNFDEADESRYFRYYFINTLQAVRQGKWKLHLPRPANPEWLGHFSKNPHIAVEDWAGFEEPFLVDLEADPGETKSVAPENPEVVAQLLKLAEEARADIGDHDRVGENMRFFDPMEKRPEKPIFTNLVRKPRKNVRPPRPAPAQGNGKEQKNAAPRMDATPSERTASFDFESGKLAPWKVVEGEFGHPVSKRETFVHQQTEYNKQGTYYFTTLETGQTQRPESRTQTGVIVSPLFVPLAGSMTFRIGGGRGAATYVALCTETGNEVAKARGINSQVMQKASWNLEPYAGRKMFIKIVDRATGSWGHITADHFEFDGEILKQYPVWKKTR